MIEKLNYCESIPQEIHPQIQLANKLNELIDAVNKLTDLVPNPWSCDKHHAGGGTGGYCPQCESEPTPLTNQKESV